MIEKIAIKRPGSVVYQVSNIIKEHNGIGESKKMNRESSSLSGENGHAVSNKFHSYNSIDNVRANLTNLAKYARENHQIKDMRMINQEVVRGWIADRDITFKSASNNLSELLKVQDKLDISSSEIKELRAECRAECKTTNLETRAYKLNKVNIAERSQISYELQKTHGLRVSEATHININRQLNENTLTVQSKGGKIIKKELEPSLAQKIRENALEGKYETSYKTYSADLKSAIEETGQNYNGTHGMRHSYAQEQLSKGLSKAEVSAELGHVREEITNIYLR